LIKSVSILLFESYAGRGGYERTDGVEYGNTGLGAGRKW